MKEHIPLQPIEQYLEGGLKGNELKDFEKSLETDPELAATVKDYKMAVKSIDLYGRNELKKRLRKIHHDEISGKNILVRRQLLKIAAIFIGFLIVSGPFLYNHFYGQPKYQNLYEQNFTIYPDILSQRGEAIPENLMLDEAMSYYKNNDFENASVLFEALDSSDLPIEDAIIFYRGISYLGEGNPEKASGIFKIIISDTKNPFRKQAEWYLALSFINLKQPVEAKSLLEEIVKNKSWNHAKAYLLLEELE
ncbi:MAG: tetratricopeptide repeat protein [Bacteroidales bacterium]|nr:tetratricopeptide repeat protein [Bacteroidales bacterium]